MIQTQSQIKEIRQNRGKVMSEVRGKAWYEVLWKVQNRVWDKVLWKVRRNLFR